MGRRWSSDLRHVHRECNKVVDKLASMTFSLPVDVFHIWPSPFLNVVELLSLDAKGVKWPKRSPLGNVLWGYPLLLIKKKS